VRFDAPAPFGTVNDQIENVFAGRNGERPAERHLAHGNVGAGGGVLGQQEIMTGVILRGIKGQVCSRAAAKACGASVTFSALAFPSRSGRSRSRPASSSGFPAASPVRCRSST